MAQITGDSLNNTLSGDVDGSVDDTLYGMAGNDTLLGLTGNDLLDGGSGADTLIGGIGDDSYVVDSLSDLVVEQANEGDDTVSANFSYTLTDNVENLVLLGTAVRGTGNDSDNTITGTSGSNIIDGGAGADLMQGGAGNDTYYVDSAFDQVVELAGEGADLVYSTVSYTLTDALENLTLLGAADLVARGNAAANTLIGNAGANLLDGGDGNDILDGGAGIDTLVGGNGNDTYIVDNANEIVRATLDAGIDTVRASVDYTLGAYQENLILTGPAVSGTGNGTDNVITGNALANTLTGGDGNDTLDGGAGVDLLVGGNGNDLYIIDNAAEIALGTLDAGIDTVKSSVDYTLGINQENLALAGSALLGIGNAGNNVIAGNGLANTLQGGDGNDTLNGGLGADILIGGAGNDVYMVDNVLDSVIEVAGEGLDVVSASVSFALREEVENLTLTGSANIDGTGNLGNNVITGNAGNNVLYGGGGGLDTLNGGAGNDTYLIDSTSVSIVEASTGGVDLVRANIDFTLGAHLENLELVGAANQGIGNAAANIITGSAVANFLDGKAGADTLIGAEGDDILVHDASDILLSGGAGNDTLLLAAPTALLDLTTASNLQGIERVDVADSGATVRLSAAAVTALSDSDLLVIDGAAGAAVTTSDAWNYVGDFGDYARYQLNGATLDIALAVTRSGVVLAAPPPPPANSLAFDSASSASVLENATGAVIDVNATNVNQPAQILSYAISGGADAGKFAIDAGSGVVSFISAPDYEAPTDSDGDNVYLLQVTASDGVLSATQDIAVSVAAVNDNTPVMTSANTANFAENATGAIMTVQAVDADLPSQSLAYSISGGVDALRFAINATTGALTFVNAPNFEAPTDASANNIYDVQVTASDGERAVSQSIAVSVTPVNDNDPVITSAATVNFAENATGTVIDVNATDADLPAPLLTYSISAGADAAKFAINAMTGVVTFVTAPNYEAPTDVGADNVYNLQVTASDGARSTAQNIAVTVTPVNEYSPVFTSLASVSFAENGTGTVLDVNANDADLPAPTLTFSITGGADAAKFAINASTGILTFVSAPNYENPTDLGADNVYNLQVTASDGARSATQAIAVTVTAVNEFAPVFSSAATASFAENGLGTVLDVNATDADLPAPTLSYSITGGVDAARFAINASTGVVTFVSAPDYENPADLGADNVYNLQVTASDGARSTTQSIAVTVTAVNEFAPVFSSAATAIFAENGTGTILTVQATDADLPAPALSYSISGGVDAAQFAIDAATGALRFVAPPSFAAPTDSGANNVYDVQVAASDGVRSTSQALAITVTTANSNAPVITSSSTVSFVENGVGPVVDVNATDADLPAQTLTYSITGGADAAKFAINASTGVVTFVSAPNFEAPTDVGADNVYVVQVTASDGALTSAQTINVTVSNTNDAPVLDASKSPALVDVSANAAAPVGTVGTLVSALVANGSGIANVSDEDGPGVGLALTSVDVSKGTWWFSTNNGTTWSTVGTVSSASALLLTGANRLYLQPAAGFSGAVANALTFQVWDTSSGTAGAKVSTAGSSAFSVASDTAGISVVGAVVTAVSSFTLDTILVTAGNGFRLSGGNSGDGAGGAIAAAGDINGDGIGDLLVGAPTAAVATWAQSGVVYGVLGQANRNSDVALAALNGTNGGFVLKGTANSTYLGASVAGRGDFNGDGLSDFVFGAPGKTLGQGEAYEMFGTSGALTTLNGFSPVNLNPTSASFPTNDGVKMVAPATFGLRTGEAVATGGDFNGDGFADSVVGMPLVDTNGASAGDSQGQVFIAFGGPSGLTNLSLTSAGMTGTGGINLDGTVDFGQVGRSVAMGDFDGDHLADVVISALGINTVYVVSGNTVNTARDNLNLANLNGANGGVKLVGPAGIDFGKQVVNVGDVNADGRDDFLVLAPKAFPVAGGSFGGAAYVVFGTNNTTLQTVNVATLNGSNGFLVHGAIFRPAFGTYGGLVNAAAAGDVNGDGIADIVLTQTLVPQGFDQLGETFVIYGKAGSFADVNNLDLHTGLNGSNGFRIVGAGDDARVSVVAGGGDLNNDGFDEMLLSMPNGGPVNGGQVIVVNGGDFRADASSAGVTTTGTVSRNADTVTGTAGADQIDGGAGNDVLSGVDGNDIVVGGVGNDTLSGGNGVDSLVGGQGDDVLDGGAGADTLYAGPGNDTLVYDAADVRIDGGYGTDTLQLAGAGVSLNLDNVSGTQLRGLEAVDLTGSGANSLRLNVQDLLNLSDTSNTLTVLGDGNDSVVATGGWGSGVNLGTVTQFTHGHAILLIDNDVLANAATSII